MNIEIIYLLNVLNIFNFLAIFIVSLVLNIFIFSIIKLGFLSNFLKERLNYLLDKKQNLISMFLFIFSFFLISYLNYNVIHLDENIIVTTKINNSTFLISGEILNTIFNNLGSAAVFTAGTRIAASLVAKHPIHLLPKTGIIGGVGAGFTITYKLITEKIPSSSFDKVLTKIQTGPIEIQLEGLKLENNIGKGQIKSLLDQYFGVLTNKVGNNSNFYFTEVKLGNIHHISGNVEQTSKIIQELDLIDPNWKEGFINSPLENSFIPFLLEALNNHLILNFITVYLLLMLLIIFICKFIISKEIQFNKLKTYPLGNYISKFLIKYISIWQSSGNIWIFLIIISLILFNIASTFSIYSLILLLKNLI